MPAPFLLQKLLSCVRALDGTRHLTGAALTNRVAVD
jgi:hypothetical protein